MQNRIKILRKQLSLNQEEFAEKIGIKRSAVSLIEIGKSKLTEQNIKLICLVLNVNETWLRTGNGPMFVTEVMGEREIVELFRQISPEGRKIVLEYIHLIFKNEHIIREEYPDIEKETLYTGG